MKTILSFLLASQALALTTSPNFRLSPRSHDIDSVADGFIDSIVEMRQRRQLSTTSGQNAFMSMSGKAASQRDQKTQNACIESLKTMRTQVSNPSGMSICYNLPFLDAKTGVFEADLRVFMVTPATGPFRDIATDKIQVGLSYAQATVSPLNASALARRMNDGESFISLPRSVNTLVMKREMTPIMVRRYGFVGQISKSLLPSNPDDLKQILAPNVSLSAVDSTGATITTSLTSDETKFVTGVFAAAQENTPTKALLAPPIQTLVVAPDAPFVVPGLNILIFPTGLIITGLWAVLIIGTIGYGTIERIQWRERFREAKMRESTGSLKRI
ncbi:hypothetical protein OnM2_037055 [Erysiphe neolycopersici]|uniref:Protein BIG1 n=1 Tax=Erysiphe neolycopersici TaxID=212602 RepID=A0A420HWW1_9PEZI|nr:hypothetical protein OnM2_037055 [Erysiphe neolycopersici]